MSYEDICSRDNWFKYENSGSMYQYYCVMALWERLLFIQSERGIDVTGYNDFVKVLNCDLAIPCDIFNGVGDLRDTADRDNELRLQ